MAKPKKADTKAQDQKVRLEDQLSSELNAAWNGMKPLRASFEEKEKTLLAQTADSISGNISRVRVTDAGLSTLTFERQARVAAQLPTGKVYAMAKKDDGKARLANIVLNRYIIPNACLGEDMLTMQRMAGVYASAFGSIPCFYDYVVDDEYIGPYAQLVDLRNFLPKAGFNHPRKCPWIMIEVEVAREFLQGILDRKTTTYKSDKVKELYDKSKDGIPANDSNSEKDSYVSMTRYDKSGATNRITLVTKYERGKKGRWVTFAPDYENLVIRDIPNPHKSGKIPVVLRQCFPLMNSIIGLGDFDRGMKIQKAKDSLLGLRLEYVKNKTFPALMIDTTKVTPSTIKNGANQKWLVQDMNAVKEFSGGQQPNQEFNSMFSVLNGIQQSQFGTSDTRVSGDESADPSVGRTPAAIKLNEARENARDTWDRFFHERFVAELYEGMLNLLITKMEKPIEVTVFEDEIRQIQETVGDDVLEMVGDDYGKLTISKKDLKSDKGFKFIIDPNSSMLQDDASQLTALKESYMMAAQDPELQQSMLQQGDTWNRVEHFKKILITSGIQDWERILQEGKNGRPGQEGAEQGQAEAQAMAEQEAQAQAEAQAEASRQDALQRVDTLHPDLEALIQESFGQQPQGAVNG